MVTNLKMKKTSKIKKIKRLSLTAVIVFVFIGFSVIIFSIIWILQIYLLGTFYQNSAKSQLQTLSDNISNIYQNRQLNDEYKDVISTMNIDDETAVRIYSYNQGYSLEYDGVNSLNTNEIITSPNSIFSLLNEDNSIYFSLENNYAIYGVIKELDGNFYYLLITMPTTDLSATINILQEQLLMAIVVSIIISLFLARFLASMITKPIKQINESVLKISSGNLDITFPIGPYRETHELANALNYTVSVLAKTDKLQKDVIANISHDFKTPLTLIKSYAEMIMDINGENKDKRDSNLQTIIDEVDRLSLIVNDVLMLSRAQAKVQGEKEVINLTELINESVIRFEELATLQDLKFGYNVTDNVFINANKVQMRNVIDNYISNAFKYCRKEIFINFYVENNECIFEVIDDGAGIPFYELEKIWQRYYRSSTTNIKSVSGSGLGLAIVKAVLDNHRFKYFVASEVGVGSTFTFKAPICVDRNIEND